MSYIPTKEGNELMTSAVKVKSRARVHMLRKRQLKSVCSAQRPSSH